MLEISYNGVQWRATKCILKCTLFQVGGSIGSQGTSLQSLPLKTRGWWMEVENLGCTVTWIFFFLEMRTLQHLVLALKKSPGSVSLADQFIFAVSLNKSYIRTSEKQIITRILRDTKY